MRLICPASLAGTLLPVLSVQQSFFSAYIPQRALGIYDDTTSSNFTIIPSSPRGPFNFAMNASPMPPFTSIQQATGPITSTLPSAKQLGIESVDVTNLKTAPGVTLSPDQKIYVGSVLDLFAGKATLPKLSLWSDTGTFADQITKAQGRAQYTAQWYGLQTVFSRIERLDYQVTGAGNPISMDLVTRYTLRGVPVPKTIESKILIWYDEAAGKIREVQDQWGGDALPEGEFAKAMRNLNSVTVPKMVGVPKTEEEDKQRRKYWPEN